MGVEPGHEVILTKDGSVNTLYSAQLSSGVGLPLSREQAFRVFERAFCFDTMEIGHPDYSYKAVKPIVALEATGVEQALLTTIIPVFYGAMPNFGLYAQPDGPFPNPADLLPRGETQAARDAQMAIAEACREDMLYVSKAMAEVGADGINFDTTASIGDAEFYATLLTVEELAEDDPPRHRGGHGGRVRPRLPRRGGVAGASGSPACGLTSRSRWWRRPARTSSGRS